MPRVLVKGKAPAKQPESFILAQVRQYLRLKGWYVIRIQQGIGCHRGLSDLIALKDGRTVFVEVKTERGRLSAYQERFRDAVLAAGGEYVVARGLEDVEGM